MRLPRNRLEMGCRLGAFALLGWLLGQALVPSSDRRVERATGETLVRDLPRWTTAGARVAMHADLDAAPEVWTIDWLAALHRAGRAVTWSGSPPAVAMRIDPIVDPSGGMRIAIAAPRGTSVRLRDDVSAIDSLTVGRVGASLTTPLLVGQAVATAGAQSLVVRTADSIVTRPVIVVGRAGWEGKFVVAALEERGWPVVARFAVAPGVDVAQGGIVLDTARVAALVALDTSVSALGEQVERYVRNGGGLVLAGGASSASNVAAIVPGALGTRRAAALPVPDTLDRASAGFYPVEMRRDAVALERRADGIAVAARRVGAGRVLSVGFDETWRWRMAGASGSEEAHREWWSRIVGAVAYTPVMTRADSSGSAPLARLIDALGPPRTTSLPQTGGGVDPRVLLALMLVLLLVEWGSRRLRGAR